MKVKHTKLKKSIFLILICISLTTTFVVSASAVETSSTVTLNYPGDSISFPFQYYSITQGNYYNQIFYILYFPFDVEIEGVFIPSNSSMLTFLYGYQFNNNSFDYPLSPVFFSGFVDSYSLSVPFDGFELSSVPLVYDDVQDGILSCIFDLEFNTPLDYTITFNLSSSPSFTDSVGSGLTSALSWVGQVVESLTTGPIKPLLECFAVTISVSALLLGIYSIRRFIWGS